MVVGGFVGVGPCRPLHAFFGYMRDVIIHELIEGHDAAHRARREIRLREQAPDPKLPGVGMRFLEVIDLHHARQPDFAGRLLGAPFAVHEPGKVFGLEARDPGVHRRPGDVEPAADAPFFPALIIEFHDLQPRLVAVRMGVIVPQRQVRL
jgi:hypothetical protein